MSSVDFYVNETNRHSIHHSASNPFLRVSAITILSLIIFSIRNTTKFSPQILLRKKGSMTKVLKELQWRMEKGNFFQNIMPILESKFETL